MSGFRTRTQMIALLALWLGSLTLALPAGPSRKAQSAKPTNSENIYYYNGPTRVYVALALDELVVLGNGNTVGKSKLSAGVKSAEQLPGAGGNALLKLVPSSDRKALELFQSKLSAAGVGSQFRAVFYQAENPNKIADNRGVLANRFSVKWKSEGDAQFLTEKYKLHIIEKVTYSANTYIVETKDGGLLSSLETANAIYEAGDAEFATPLIEETASKRAVPNDPLFANQWHLLNTGANAAGAVAGNDVNVVNTWDTIRGSGINIAITDDGIQTAHPDLIDNVRTDIDLDINSGDLDPNPTGASNHGTACAGVAAARDNNTTGVSGAAPAAGLVGIRLLGAANSDAQNAQALNHQINDAVAANIVHINSNSWGPTDNGLILGGSGPLARAALANATATGRDGKGTIFTWACGNGFESLDDSNYDSFANDPHVIAVAASGSNGVQSYYSEEGANVLVNAPSSYAGGGITTTDRTGGNGYTATDYTSTFGGTSSACPLVAGCVALILEANPNLTWRDVQHILVQTSTKNDSTEPGWLNNAAGNHFNRKYGFGRINVGAAVSAAQSWTNVPASAAEQIQTDTTPEIIPDGNSTGITRSLTIAGPENFRAEHVLITVNITHTYRGDMVFYLTSPSGTVVKLAQRRTGDLNDNYSNWTFSSVATWGELANGSWQLRMADVETPDSGTLNSWSIKVLGYSGDGASIQSDVSVSIPDDLVKYKATSTGEGKVSVGALVSYTLAVPDKKAKTNALVKFYLSTDSVKDDSDALLIEKSVKNVKTAKAKKAKVKFTISEIDKGKFILAVVESAADQNPANNIAVKAIPLDAF